MLSKVSQSVRLAAQQSFHLKSSVFNNFVLLLIMWNPSHLISSLIA